MIRLIRTIQPENNMAINEVASFETESCVGIWAPAFQAYILMEKNARNFDPATIPDVDSFDELDAHVMSAVSEHITGVSSVSAYHVKLEATDDDE